MEYWYDPRHTGALRVIHRLIYDSDPAEESWTTRLCDIDRTSIEVDFAKETHHGRRLMIATYKNRRNELHWEDGNVWLRIRVDPFTTFKKLYVTLGRLMHIRAI